MSVVISKRAQSKKRKEKRNEKKERNKEGNRELAHTSADIFILFLFDFFKFHNKMNRYSLMKSIHPDLSFIHYFVIIIVTKSASVGEKPERWDI